MRLICQD